MDPSTSRYRVFETAKFRNAPLSKCLAFSTLAGSLCSIPFRHYRSAFVISDIKNWSNFGQLIKFALSRVFVLDFKDIVAGCLSIYLMRHVERRYGTRKYADFLILICLTSISLEILIHSFLGLLINSTGNHISPLSEVTAIAYGPYALLFGTFVQFYCDIPFVPYAKVFGIPLSVKNLPLLFMVQMLISTKEVFISCLSGLLAGILYRQNVFKVQTLTVIPDWMSKWTSYILAPLLRLGENNVGRLLPIGATVEAQRQDIYDRYEQSLIYQRIQRQHLLDERSDNPSLSIADRWFNRRRSNNNGASSSNGDAALLVNNHYPNPATTSGTLPNGLFDMGAAAAAAANSYSSSLSAQHQVRACEEKVRTLVEMGFADRHRVEQVLRNTNNDLNTAALVLLQDASSTVA